MSAFDNKVELVWVTPNAEQLITKMARVSNPANEDNMETAPRLLRYLIKHRHWSPFELGNMCVKINTERDISAQILRHRSFTFQEYSSRYSNMTMADTPKFRRQDLKNRQNSIDDLSADLIDEMQDKVAVQLASTYNVYQELLDKGVAKECARRILPLCTPTTLYMNGTIRSFIHYIELRSANGTQKEHQDIALKIKNIFTKQLPIISEALWFN
jgi:thymidylate synthase (FAD)